ncbi:hypothetical protein [Romboutsia lituseburensis]|uniref:hypothetical protein n=1 Tax=Romboutsia lituseburensis TaxID=1537 RepID=UPI00215B342D|nr:hypothetical protein [Romboutsia lituseburensis]MCR8744550.1 hypothetical protein [Romboutsia lituseburensis]
MENKKSLTQSILSNIGNKTINPLEAKKDNNEVKLDLNSFIMVPINHPKINEVIRILNENKGKTDKSKTDMKYTDLKNNINYERHNKQENSEKNTRLIITLNDILNNFDENQIIIPKNSIITPLAHDYIKQKNIELIFNK